MLGLELISKIEAYSDLIFDLDNTIFPQQDYDRGAFRDIASSLQKTQSKNLSGLPDFLLAHKTKMGAGYPRLFNDALKEFHLSEALLPQFIDIYYRHDGCEIRVDNSLVPLFRQLTNKRLFIVTNGPEKVQITKITKLGLRELASEIVICTPKQPDKLKPSLYAFDLLNEKHQLTNTVMIGDSAHTDGEFAKTAGLPFIYFNITENLK